LKRDLRAAFPDYEVSRRSVRGSEPGKINLIFELQRKERSRWLRFEPIEANGTYHSDQGGAPTWKCRSAAATSE
jgi:hypothetical protein